MGGTLGPWDLGHGLIELLMVPKCPGNAGDPGSVAVVVNICHWAAEAMQTAHRCEDIFHSWLFAYHGRNSEKPLFSLLAHCLVHRVCHNRMAGDFHKHPKP